MKICILFARNFISYQSWTHAVIFPFQIAMSQTKCPTFEDKLNAIEVWMKETEDAVSSQDSYKEDALTPDAIDLIIRYGTSVRLKL